MDEQTPIFTISIGDSPLPFPADYGFAPAPAPRMDPVACGAFIIR